MASTVNLPIVGPANKGTVIGVAIGGTALAGYMIYKKQKTAKAQAAAAAAASQASSQAASGYGYGVSQSAGYGGLYDNGYYGYGASGGFNATGYYGYGTPYPGETTAPVANTTNAQWSQAAISQLTQEGYAATDVSAALGAYLAGTQLTPTQQSIIQAAIAVEGYPPQTPPAMQVQGTTGGGTGGGQSSSTSTAGSTSTSGSGSVSGPPWVIGQTVSQAIATLQAAGYTVGTVSQSGIAGVRQETTLPQNQYGTAHVVSQSNMSNYPGGPSSGNTISLIAI